MCDLVFVIPWVTNHREVVTALREAQEKREIFKNGNGYKTKELKRPQFLQSKAANIYNCRQ